MRAVIGDAHYRSIFELSYGSALAILIDTSGSMDSEIDAIKQEVAAIIEEAQNGGVEPSLYVLGAYEQFTDLTVTKDSGEFLDAVNALTANGVWENFYTAALDVLNVVSPYSDIIAFTDEENPEDESRMKATVIALAQEKHCRITVIWTGIPL